MANRGEKLQLLHFYQPFSDSSDINLTKNHYENYSPKIVPIAKIWGSGSWTNSQVSLQRATTPCMFSPQCMNERTWKFAHLSLQLRNCETLTRWGRVTHICVCKLTIIGLDNDLLHDRRQAMIWTNAGILLVWPLGTNYSEILIEIHLFSIFIKENTFENVVCEMSAILSRPQYVKSIPTRNIYTRFAICCVYL